MPPAAGRVGIALSGRDLVLEVLQELAALLPQSHGQVGVDRGLPPALLLMGDDLGPPCLEDSSVVGTDGFHEVPEPGQPGEPQAGDEELAVFDGSGWVNAIAAGLNPAPLVGVNATADTANRLAVASPASLFSHDGDDHRLKINKAAAGDTASVLFQTGFSGRAEFGLPARTISP